MNEPQLSAEMRKHCMCERCKDGVIHAACCAVHNMPAEPNGECDCEPETPAFSEDLSYYWQRILGEDWTNNQPLYELYLWVVKELATALEEQREELFAKFEEDTKELRHFYDTTIGLLATDRSYEDIRMIIYEAIEASFDLSGLGKPTADVSLPVVLSAQEKLKKIMWMIEPIKVAIPKKARE